MISLPNFLGSVLFVVGGVCEVLINRQPLPHLDETAWRPGHPKRPGALCLRLASWFTLLGSTAFLVASTPAMAS